MQLRDIVHGSPITVAPDDTIVTAAQRMRDANVGCLIVTDRETVQGIITDRDLAVRCVSESHSAQQCRVEQHMSSPVISAAPDMDPMDAVYLMAERQVRRLPVLEGNQLVGVVSLSDIAEAMEQLLHGMHNLLRALGPAHRIT